MATKSENADIAVLQTEMKTMSDAVRRIETKLDMQNAVYVTRGEFDEFKKRWVMSHLIAAIVPSILTGLVVHFLVN